MIDLKERVCAEVDNIRDRLIAVSRDIHDHPELSFEEYRASRRLAEELEKEGFDVALGVGGLDTAIKAKYPRSSGDGPCVAIFGEYDALPEIGHACGHNLIAAAGLGAVIALGRVKNECPGTLLFFGTPAEERGGGKVILLREGVFSDVDVAMMVHPANQTRVYMRGLAAIEVKIEFFGKAAHAAGAPEKGINALNAVIQTFCLIDAMRQHIKDEARIHGIITDGGARPNIVPEHSAAIFYVRARERGYRDELVKKVRQCVEGAAHATGCSYTFEATNALDEIKKSDYLIELFSKNLSRLNIQQDALPELAASTDMGNVSQVIPSIHPLFKICREEVVPHTKEFAEAAISEQGHAAMLQAAKAMAMTAIDLFTNPDAVKRIKDEFKVRGDQKGT